jgi:hypothetical protein
MWIPDRWQPLPTNEWLLTVADHCHNRTGNRGFGTFAVGAVGQTPLKVRFVIGVNSSCFHETNLTSDQNVPPVVRNALELASLEMTKEPYHAEVSCVLWAKENNMKLFAVASSRQVCPDCTDFLIRHAPTAEVVDTWKTTSGTLLTQKQREDVNLGSDWGNKIDSGIKAVYSRNRSGVG